VEVRDRDKHSSFLHYGRRKFYDTGQGGD